MILEKYSFGIGDRFGHQGKAQLQAMIIAQKNGIEITPVWNKSNREHSIIHTAPSDVRKEADAAVRAMGWSGSYRVDADHISLKNVDGFIEASDFFTLDVSDFIGNPVDEKDVSVFVGRCRKYIGPLAIPGICEEFEITKPLLETIARKYLKSVKEAAKIYRHVAGARGDETFITEVSMDETGKPQTPVEMFFILAAISCENIPVQTIAPKFSGRFNKGVDYVGNVSEFAKEFEEDLAVIAFAVKEFGLPENLKLSIHSGSDKFSIYKPISNAIRKFDAGLHLKTAGTTWLEELIGLAMAEGSGLAVAKKIYANALGRFDELCKPYLAVIDIDKSRLPSPQTVEKWSGGEYAQALRHDQSCRNYNPDFRQLLHVGYKVAAELGREYIEALEKYADTVAKNVTENIYERHIRQVFIL